MEAPTCTSCAQTKPRAEFYLCQGGCRLQQPCRACKKTKRATNAGRASRRALHAKNKAKINTQAKARRDADIEAARAKDRTRYAINPEPRRASSKRSAAKNKVHRREYMKTWAAENAHALRERQRNRYALNPIPTNIRNSLRRSLERKIGVVTDAEWVGIVEENESACVYCGAVDRKLTIDHVIPISRGGKTVRGNLVPACKSCNSKKKDKLPLNFIWQKAG